MKDSEQKRLDKLERLARNNRALVILWAVLSPFLVSAVLYTFSIEFRDGRLAQASLKSRDFNIPGETQVLIVIIGMGGLLGLSKEQLANLIISRFQQKIPTNKDGEK